MLVTVTTSSHTRETNTLVIVEDRNIREFVGQAARSCSSDTSLVLEDINGSQHIFPGRSIVRIEVNPGGS